METKYKCEKCGSESKGTPGTCCGGERKICDTYNVENADSKMASTEHDHKEGEVCAVCSAK